MPVTDGIATALERNWDMVDRALAGMATTQWPGGPTTPATPCPGFSGI